MLIAEMLSFIEVLCKFSNILAYCMEIHCGENRGVLTPLQ